MSTILVDDDFCQIAWLAWFNSDIRIKYDRTCQRSIKIISIEKTFVLHKSAQKKHFFLEFFFKESSWLALFNHLKIANFEKSWFFTLDDTLNYEVYLALEFKDFPAPTAIFKDFEGPWIFISKFKDFQGVCEPCVWYCGIGYPQCLTPFARK